MASAIHGSCTSHLSSRDAARPPHFRLRLRSARRADRAAAARAARREPAHGRRPRDGHHRASARSPTCPRCSTPRDLLVVNRSRVVRARLLGTRVGSGAPAEIFLLTPLGGDRYEAMVSPGGKLKPGRRRRDRAGLLGRDSRGHRAAHAHRPASRRRAASTQAIERHGHIPLPPYIERAGRSRRRGAVSDGVRARGGLRRRADGRAALHARAARRASRRAGRARAPKSCCTSAPARSSRSRSRIPPST